MRFTDGVTVLAEAGHAPSHSSLTFTEILAVASFVLFAVGLDLLLNRKAKEMKFSTACLQTALFVALGLGFGFVVLHFYGGVGIKEYYSIFASEYSLSVDNLFIFMILLKQFRVQRELQPRALFWGINMAIVIRIIMIAAGTALLNNFVFLFGPIALYMLWTAYGTFKNEEEDDVTEMWPYRIVTRFIPVTYRTYRTRLFIQQDGKRVATVLLLVIALLGMFDALFALDSVPTAIALSTIPLVTIAGNVNAVLGLRPMYFVISHLTKYITRLNWGVGGILVWIAIKMLLKFVDWLHSMGWVGFAPPEPSSNFSLIVLGACLAFGLVAGKIWPVPVEDLEEEAASDTRVNVRVYVDAGYVMVGEWRDGLVERYLPQVVQQAEYYDSEHDVPVYAFGDRIEVLDMQGLNLRQRPALGDGSNLAGVLRHAKEGAETLLGTHIIMVLTAGVPADQNDAVAAFADMPPNTFVVFVRVSDEPGGAEWLQALDDMYTGERDRCNTVHATDDHGRPLREIETEIGVELDAYLHKLGALPTQRATV